MKKAKVLKRVLAYALCLLMISDLGMPVYEVM